MFAEVIILRYVLLISENLFFFGLGFFIFFFVHVASNPLKKLDRYFNAKIPH